MAGPAALGPAVLAPYVSDRAVHAVSFEPGLEQQLLEGLRPGEAGSVLAIDVDAAQSILAQLGQFSQQAEEQNVTPVLACAPQLRAAVRRMVEPSVARLPVVSYTELSGPVQIRSVGVVTGAVAAIGA